MLRPLGAQRAGSSGGVRRPVGRTVGLRVPKLVVIGQPFLAVLFPREVRRGPPRPKRPRPFA
eukprot:6760055-Lingulodinium_polyedra.AAC.1